MITCPTCNHQELSGALFCSKCGTQIFHIDRETSTNIQHFSIEEFIRIEIPPFPEPPPNAVGSKVALLILDQDEVLHIQREDEFILGRTTQGQTVTPDIDLGPYQAYALGVSRLHANLDTSQAEITITDIGSANGTRLNGIRIEPNQVHTLKNGDILTLGKLKIQVLIQN